MKPEAWPARGLYLITPDSTDTASLLARVAAVLPCRPALLQYRAKQAGATLRREQATALLALCRGVGVPLVVNDDLPLAVAIGAQGVHLGHADGDIGAARAALGPAAIIGASCYDRIELARDAARAGASYVAFGAFFPSPTKPHAARASIELLEHSESLQLPRVAIGGITPENAGTLQRAGADLVAVISGVFDAADPVAAARAYQSAFQDIPR